MRNSPDTHRHHIILGPTRDLGLADALRVAHESVVIDIDERCREDAVRGTELLSRLSSSDSPVYGLTTGFGPLASHSATGRENQLHLIAHLATGTGPALPAHIVRLMMMDRLWTIGRGMSLASEALIEGLNATLDKDLIPYVPAFGSVGASGDLTPLAHLALAMSGSGRMRHLSETEFRPSREVLQEAKLSTQSFDGRDALALVNGTSASFALLAESYDRIMDLFSLTLVSQAMMVTALDAPRAAYDERLHAARIHPGQRKIARAMRMLLEDAGAAPISNPAADFPQSSGHERQLQAAYSFRCIPQILGPVLEDFGWCLDGLERELNAVTDNPVFDLAAGEAIHGGNFHAQPLSHVADRLSLGMASLASLLDRQIARITDSRLSGGLPAFLSPKEIGINSGFMGAQVSATALTAELSAQAQKRYLLQSRSTNGANQDVVSMSTLAAWSLYSSLPRLAELVAIHCLVAAQAMDLTGGTRSMEPVGSMASLHRTIRSHSPMLQEDRPLSEDIMTLAELAGTRAGREALPAMASVRATLGL